MKKINIHMYFICSHLYNIKKAKMLFVIIYSILFIIPINAEVKTMIKKYLSVDK